MELSVTTILCRRKQLKDNFTQSTPIYGGAWHANSTIEDDHGTSHMSVVDKDRIAVSMTSTVNTRFGSLLYSNTTGIAYPYEVRPQDRSPCSSRHVAAVSFCLQILTGDSAGRISKNLIVRLCNAQDFC